MSGRVIMLVTCAVKFAIVSGMTTSLEIFESRGPSLWTLTERVNPQALPVIIGSWGLAEYGKQFELEGGRGFYWTGDETRLQEALPVVAAVVHPGDTPDEAAINPIWFQGIVPLMALDGLSPVEQSDVAIDAAHYGPRPLRLTLGDLASSYNARETTVSSVCDHRAYLL